jgi:signal transduction histidine kinase
MSRTAVTAAERIALANPQWLLGLMLLALHVALAWGSNDWWPRAVLLAHSGLFLLWQPVWRGEREIELRQALVVVMVAMLLVGWFSWWLMALWVAILFGVIGGMVPRIEDRRQRLISVLAAIYLLSMLLMWVVPQLFRGVVLADAHVLLVRYGLPVVPVAILLVRVPSGRPHTPVGVDLIYSVILFLLVVALVLGSFVVHEVSAGQYAFALAQTLIVIAVLLVGISWLWAPHSSFLGVGYMLSSYFLSLGLPFERWVQRLSDLAQEETHPQRFLSKAAQHMLDMPWVRGVEWKVPHAEGELGMHTAHATRVEFGDLALIIYTRWEASPAILLHLKLLARMLGHFYEAKAREQAQRQSAYTHAVYETGARLTHDVKNLLQSLKSLCSAASTSTPEQAIALQALMQRQLPQIAQRLNTTLDKLRAPQPIDARPTDAAVWWAALIQRYSGRNIDFSSDTILSDVKLPAELFDTVADNLIENAFNKTVEKRIQVRVTFAGEDRGTLTVCDDGPAIPENLAAQLLDAPVASHTGFGIGLYQSSRLATQFGYVLTLAMNRAGTVCFTLSGGAHAAADVTQRQVA